METLERVGYSLMVTTRRVSNYSIALDNFADEVYHFNSFHIISFFLVNAAGSNNSDTHGKMFLNIEFRTKNQNGEVKLRNIRISISEFVNFLQQLREMQKGSMQ